MVLVRVVAGHPPSPDDLKSSVNIGQQTRRRKERKSQVRLSRHHYIQFIDILQLYFRRLHVAQLYSRQHSLAVRAVQELGVSGMSSDESDHESGRGPATYAIVNKDWRSSGVMELLRLLNALHLRWRYQNNWNPTLGAWPHLRLLSRKSSTRAAVKGLPNNVYSPKFLASLTQEAFDELCLIEEILPVEISDGLRGFVISLVIYSFPELTSYTISLASPYDIFNRTTVSSRAHIAPGNVDEFTT